MRHIWDPANMMCRVHSGKKTNSRKRMCLHLDKASKKSLSLITGHIILLQANILTINPLSKGIILLNSLLKNLESRGCSMLLRTVIFRKRFSPTLQIEYNDLLKRFHHQKLKSVLALTIWQNLSCLLLPFQFQQLYKRLSLLLKK